MKTEDIVVSLDMAKRLKTAGYPQFTSCFLYAKVSHVSPDLYTREEAEDWIKEFGTTDRKLFFDCPTAEEILLKFPSKTTDGSFPRKMALIIWDIGEYPSLADSAAAKWIFLKQNNLL